MTQRHDEAMNERSRQESRDRKREREREREPAAHFDERERGLVDVLSFGGFYFIFFSLSFFSIHFFPSPFSLLSFFFFGFRSFQSRRRRRRSCSNRIAIAESEVKLVKKKKREMTTKKTKKNKDTSQIWYFCCCCRCCCRRSLIPEINDPINCSPLHCKLLVSRLSLLFITARKGGGGVSRPASRRLTARWLRMSADFNGSVPVEAKERNLNVISKFAYSSIFPVPYS